MKIENNNIYDNMVELKNVFNKIKYKKIKSIREDYSGMGYTFESLINKKIDSSFLPDFNGIEIKTKYKKSDSDLKLFNYSPKRDDGMAQARYFINNYGYLTKKNRIKFMRNIFYNELTELNHGHFFKLILDRENNKLIISIINYNLKIIDNSTYWNLDELKERLYTKLSYLAFIRGYIFTIDNIRYNRYTDISFYKLKDFDTFIELIKQGKIYLNFEAYQLLNTNCTKTIFDKGVAFKIKLNSIDELFDKIEI